jgi:hypothetical protein
MISVAVLALNPCSHLDSRQHPPAPKGRSAAANRISSSATARARDLVANASIAHITAGNDIDATRRRPSGPDGPRRLCESCYQYSRGASRGHGFRGIASGFQRCEAAQVNGERRRGHVIEGRTRRCRRFLFSVLRHGAIPIIICCTSPMIADAQRCASRLLPKLNPR